MANSKLPVFTERFIKLRGDLTQAQFADMLEISRPTVSLYESGARTPEAAILKKIAEKMNVSVDYLLGLRDDPASDKDMQFIVDYTGLSSEAIEKLHTLAPLQGHRSGILENFSRFVSLFYMRFLWQLSVLKDTTEFISEQKETAPETMSLCARQLKNALYTFSDYCQKIPEELFNTGSLYEECESKAAIAYFTKTEEEINDYLKSMINSEL